MNISVYIKACILSFTVVCLSSCAKIGSPTGGPRDTTPPVVMATVPEANSVNFTDDRIVITFNEYVTLDNINDNLIVSPPLATRPKVWLKGKSVIVDIEEDLREDFTYTFNFQNAIKDLNEGNILEGYRFVVATGPTLDSLSVTGNVYYAENLETPEKIFVMAYGNLADTAVQKTLPDYVGVIDPFGYFRIDNMKRGTYNLYALKDVDNNKRYNLPDEEFAFSDHHIELSADSSWIPPAVADTAAAADTTVAEQVIAAVQDIIAHDDDTLALAGKYKLFMFKKAVTARYLSSSQRKSKSQFEFIASLPPDSMDFEFSLPETTSENTFIAEHSAGRDTLLVWLTDSTLMENNPLAVNIRYPFTDSTGAVGYKTDTLNLRYVEARTPRNAVAEKPVPLAITTNFSAGGIRPGEKLVMRSETPLVPPDTSLIKLFSISEKDTLRAPFSLLRDSLTATKYILETNVTPDIRYLFTADSGAFRDIYGKYSDSTGVTFSQKPETAYGKLSFNIQNAGGKIIVQLLSNDETKVIMQRHMEGQGKAEFPLLDPGTYRARIIFDADGNGIWTTGDFEKKQQPEHISYYPDEIEVKARFDIEQDWDAATHNEKNQKLRAVKK